MTVNREDKMFSDALAILLNDEYEFLAIDEQTFVREILPIIENPSRWPEFVNYTRNYRLGLAVHRGTELLFRVPGIFARIGEVNPLGENDEYDITSILQDISKLRKTLPAKADHGLTKVIELFSFKIESHNVDKLITWADALIRYNRLTQADVDAFLGLNASSDRKVEDDWDSEW